MADDTVDLDDYRCLTAQMMIDMRRQRLHGLHIDRENAGSQQDKLEELLAAGPAQTLSMAAVKAAYLLQLFAAVPDGPESTRRELIYQTLGDLRRLSDFEEEA